MAHEYEEHWDEFLDVYGAVRQQRDSLKLLIVELIEHIKEAEEKDRYLKAYKEIIHGAC